MTPRHTPSAGRWTRVQRRVRLLVPAPIRRADLAVFRAAARTHVPLADPVLSWLTRAANHSRLWIALAAVLSALGGRFGKRAAVRGLAATAATSAVTNLPAKLLAGRTRPDASIVPAVRRLARVPTSTSFPSGHAASAFAFATAAGLEIPRARMPLLGLASAVAYSRVHTGVHYPGDVLVGAAIGAGMAVASRATWPLVPSTPAAGALADEDVTLPGADGTGLVVVANLDAGAPTGFLLDQLERGLPAARVIELEPDETDLDHALRRAAEGARALGVVGGDGTVSAAAAAASAAGIPLLVVPGGTLNHLGADLGIRGVDDAIRAVRQRRVVRMDLCTLGGLPFVNSASLGLYPSIVARRERLEGWIGKWPAALWSLLAVLARGAPVDVEVDGVARRLWLAFLGNGRHVTVGMAPTWRRRLDDGVVDVRIVHDEIRWARTRVAVAALADRLDRCGAYEQWTTTEVSLRVPEGLAPVARDGELGTVTGSFTVQVEPGALRVLQPRPAGIAAYGRTTGHEARRS